MATTTLKPAYAASASLSITLASLGASATAGRSSLAIDNTTNLYDDALVTVSITTSASALAAPKVVNVYLYSSEDGTNFEQEESAAPGTDAAYTINSPSVFRLAVAIPVATSSKVYTRSFSVAKFFGGVLPRKWGIIVVNNTGQSLAASGNSASYSGIQWQQV